MNEIDDKIDYIPGAPEGLSFFKALGFIVLSALILFFGALVGWSAGSLIAIFFVVSFGGNMNNAIDVYALMSSVGGFILAAIFLIPRLHSRLYRW